MLNQNVALAKRNVKVVKLWKEGKTGIDIALRLKMTRSAVMGVISRARHKGLLDHRRANDPKANVVEKKVIKRTRQTPSLPKVKTEPKPAPTPAVKIISGNISSYLFPEKKRKSKSAVKFAKLTRFMCKYVINSGHPQDYLFCGQPRLGLHPYCEEHMKLCYVSIAKYQPKTKSFKRSKYDPRT